VLKGIAFDGGSGIQKVQVSEDGQQWRDAALGKDIGRFSFREWSLPFTPSKKGALTLHVRATSLQGDVQPAAASWNPGGYARNVIEVTRVVAV
jgi:hypothetical protein